MRAEETPIWSQERVVVFTSEPRFLKEVEQNISAACVKQVSTRPHHPSELEDETGQPPTLVVIEVQWESRTDDWEPLMRWFSSGQDIRSAERLPDLPDCLASVSLLSAFRSKYGWGGCLILVVSFNKTGAPLIQLCHRLGADWVLPARTGWTKELGDVVLRLRRDKAAPRVHTQHSKLRVLVAENSVATFLLLDAMLSDFCQLVMALDDHGQSLQECRTLSAESIIRDFKESPYDAVIVDMALTVRQQDFAENLGFVSVGGVTLDSERDPFESMVDENLDGLVAVKLLRQANAKIPICVFSNYVGYPGFQDFLRRYWGSWFDSIAVFLKSPDDRLELKQWLASHARLQVLAAKQGFCGG